MLTQKHVNLNYRDDLYSENCCGKKEQKQQELLSFLALVE